ncbi:MAG: FG-GAP-like repeat-containing protein [Saprospiraceae bacterium]
MYQKLTRLFLWFSLMANGMIGQTIFTKITEGAVVNSPNDSRSVNGVDVNGDGWDDLFISTGPRPATNDLLYLNNQNGTFTAVTNDPIVQENGSSDGATFADADNDGDLDAFVVTWYGQLNFFFRNKGDGTFEYLPNALTANIGTYSETATWGDYDKDGWVDLYLTNSEGQKQNMLYRNLGNGSFERITTGALVTEADLSRCANWIDYDNDGDQDLFVTNESNQPNDLFRNDGNGQFSKITAGALVTSQRGSMSASWGDVDNDGDFDVIICNSGNFAPQNNQLFFNNGNGTFSEVTEGSVVTDGGCSFGSAFGDVDNDGDLDLVVANGYCSGEIRNLLYLNNGQGQFTRAPESLETPCSFGLALSDYDKDGFLDLAISTCKNANASPLPNNLLYHNNGNNNKWLKIKLEGTTSNRAAIGTKVRIKTTINGQSLWQLREISAQSGYNGQNSLTAHFGLKDATSVDSVIIDWTSGNRQVLTNVMANQQLFVLEANTTDVKENPLFQSFRIYPNPFENQLYIEGTLITAISDITFTLIDTLGRVVFQEQVTNVPAGRFSHQLSVPSSQLAKGTYYLRLQSGQLTTAYAVAVAR